MRYKFTKPLIDGIIKSRPNEFTMNVEIAGILEKCHCPTKGDLGDLSNVPCLLSENAPGRFTRFSVEAIFHEKNWIGINQNKANHYMEFFLMNKQFSKIATGSLSRENKLGFARIDFLMGNTFIEIKTPLTEAAFDKKDFGNFSSFDKLLKHLEEVSNGLKYGYRAAIILCFLFDAKPYKIPDYEENYRNNRALMMATRKGVSFWQANLKIDKNGVDLIRYFPLKLRH
jgi:sugar fermentation stimulation protein A